MSRPIKFRFWDKDTKQLIFSGTDNWAREAVQLEMFFAVTDRYSNGEYQQFTGLQDVAGKDMYEGDILKVRGYFKGEYESYSTGVVTWSEYDAGFHINVHKNGKPYWAIYSMNEIRERNDFFVLGNIFENPELLK